MAVNKDHKLMLKKLKKQVRMLERREEQTKNKMRAAIAKMRKLSRTYKSRLESKMRMMKGKVIEAEHSSYAKAALHLERQMVKGIESKGKAIASALTQIEKKYAAKLKKSMAKKGRKAGKTPSAKSRKTKVSKKK